MNMSDGENDGLPQDPPSSDLQPAPAEKPIDGDASNSIDDQDATSKNAVPLAPNADDIGLPPGDDATIADDDLDQDENDGLSGTVDPPKVETGQEELKISATENDDPVGSAVPKENPAPIGDGSGRTHEEENSEEEDYRKHVEKRDETQASLADATLAACGATLVDKLLDKYDQGEQAILAPGLHVVVGPSPFALAWAFGHKNSHGTFAIEVGGQRLNGKPHNLRKVIDTYKSDGFITTIVDRNAAKYGPFWQCNEDLDAIDRKAKAEQLSLVFILPPKVMNEFSHSKEQLGAIKGLNRDMSPEPVSVLKDLIEEICPPERLEVAENLSISAQSNAFEPVFAALKDRDFDTVFETLKTEGMATLEAKWDVLFNGAMVHPKTRDPAAATAMYLGAYFPGLPRRIFQHVWGILQVTIREIWREPVINPDSEDNPRPWRDSSDDDALFEIGLSMKKRPDGVSCAAFSSAAKAEYFAELISARTPEPYEKLSASMLFIVRPLNLGHAVSEPAARLLARLIQDDHGYEASAQDIAKSCFSIVREHRRTVEEALIEARHSLLNLQNANATAFDFVIAQLTALYQDGQNEHLAYLGPEFIVRCLKEFSRGADTDVPAAVMRELWAEARNTYSEEDTQNLDFWRLLITGMTYVIGMKNAVGFLAGVFQNDPGAFLIYGRGASNGLLPIDVADAFADSVEEFQNSQGVEQAWKFGATTALATYWMHVATETDHGSQGKSPNSRFIHAVANCFLTTLGYSYLANLSQMSKELGEQSKSFYRLDKKREGTLARALVIGQMRLLYEAKGSDFEFIRKAVDNSQQGSRFRHDDRWTADAGSRFEDFDIWCRNHAGSAGLAMLIAEARISKRTAVDVIEEAIKVAPDADVAKKILSGSTAFLVDDFDRRHTAFGRSQQELKDFDWLVEMLGSLKRHFDAE